MAILDYSQGLGQNAGQISLDTRQQVQNLQLGQQQGARQQQVFEQQQQDRLAQQQAVQREQEARQEGSRLLQSGTPSEIAAFGIENPLVMKDFIQSANFQDQQSQASRVQYAQDILSGTVEPKTAINARIAEVQSSGGDASGLIRTAQGSDAEIVAAAEKDLAVMAPKMYSAYRVASGKQAAKSLPAESVAFNDLIKDFTPEQQNKAKQIKAGLKGRAMSNAVLSAIESGDVNNLAQAKAKIRQAEKFAEATGASRAKTIDKGFESINKINNGIGNIDRAISALDRGAGVGAIEQYLPSIKAASVELNNIQGSMALDVVGATTFGALSKGELDLARNIALPTGLDTPELIDYLNRRKVAQEKLRGYYNEQIQFLDQGGTVAGFLRSKEKGQAQQPQTQQQQAPDAALQMLQQNPNLADQFQAKFGYLPEGR